MITASHPILNIGISPVINYSYWAYWIVITTGSIEDRFFPTRYAEPRHGRHFVAAKAASQDGSQVHDVDGYNFQQNTWNKPKKNKEWIPSGNSTIFDITINVSFSWEDSRTFNGHFQQLCSHYQRVQVRMLRTSNRTFRGWFSKIPKFGRRQWTATFLRHDDFCQAPGALQDDFWRSLGNFPLSIDRLWWNFMRCGCFLWSSNC